LQFLPGDPNHLPPAGVLPPGSGGRPRAAEAPPVKDGVACHLDLKKTYRVAKVARDGLPLDVTCADAEDGYLLSEPAFNRKITLVR
jgi:hypothetical protein